MLEKCVHCGATVPAKSTFCPHCGQPLADDGQSAGSNKKYTGKKIVYSLIALLVAVLVTGGYYFFQGNSSTEEKTAITNTVQEQNIPKDSLAMVKKTLSDAGIKGDVVASSKKGEDGFLALLKFEDGYDVLVYNSKNNLSVGMEYNKKIHQDMSRILSSPSKGADGTENYGPLIFNLLNSNDNTASIDTGLGKWHNGIHAIPVYALFETKDNKIISARFYSASSLHPSHYHSDVKDPFNIAMANIVVNHMKEFVDDVNERHIRFPY